MKNAEYITESELDIVEITKLIVFLNQRKSILIIFTLIGLIIGAVIEKRTPTPPTLYQAKLSAELARDINGRYIDDTEDIAYIVKKRFNVSLKQAATIIIIELSMVDRDQEKARTKVNEAFLFIKKRQEEIAQKTPVQTTAKIIKETKVSKVAVKKYKGVLRIVKLGLAGFLLAILTLLVMETLKRIRKRLSKNMA